MNTWNYGELQEKDSKTDTLYNIQFKNWHVEKDLIQSMTRCKVIYSKFGNFKKHKKSNSCRLYGVKWVKTWIS